jgi:hypothetical protein
VVQEDLLLKKTPNQFLKAVSKLQDAKAAAAAAAAAAAFANAAVADELPVPAAPCPDAENALAGDSGHSYDNNDVNDAAAEFHHPVNDSGGAVPVSGDDDQFVVRKLIDKRSVPAVSKATRGTKRPVTEYLVWWQGCPEEEATWEPADNISSDLITAFESHQRPPGLRCHFSSVANHALQVCSLRLVHLKYTTPPPPPPPPPPP